MKRIGLDTWVKIAALVEALVVVVSALFIAAQQHLQSQQLRAQTAINATQLATQRIFQVQSTPEFDRVLQAGFADYASLSGFDQMRYRRYVLMNLFVGEDFYYQHEDGLMSDEIWDNWRRGLARHRGELDKPYGAAGRNTFRSFMRAFSKSCRRSRQLDSEPGGHHERDPIHHAGRNCRLPDDHDGRKP